jgi:hypothetical protein
MQEKYGEGDVDEDHGLRWMSDWYKEAKRVGSKKEIEQKDFTKMRRYNKRKQRRKAIKINTRLIITPFLRCIVIECRLNKRFFAAEYD